MRRSTAGALVLLAVVLTACAPPPSSSPSVGPSPASSQSEAANLPPGCELVELRGPDGVRVVVDGVWLEDTDNTPMTWWIRTAGDCVWGAGYIDEVGTDGQVVARPDQVQSLSGHTGVDFVITGEVIWLGPLPGNAPGNPARYSPLRMVIEFDETGNVTLREDREPGVFGPRCPDPSGFCPDPLVLRRTDEDG